MRDYDSSDRRLAPRGFRGGESVASFWCYEGDVIQKGVVQTISYENIIAGIAKMCPRVLVAVMILFHFASIETSQECNYTNTVSDHVFYFSRQLFQHNLRSCYRFPSSLLMRIRIEYTVRCLFILVLCTIIWPLVYVMDCYQLGTKPFSGWMMAKIIDINTSVVAIRDIILTHCL